MTGTPGKVLVTGGAGFIGSYVVERLLQQGSEVLILDHSAPGTLKQLDFPDGVEVFHGDVRDDVVVTEAAAHVDGIVHLAAVLGTQETISNPRPAAHTNILGSLNVLEAANQYDLPVVYAGVGNHWMRTEGAGTYTISKTAVEDFIRMYNKFRGGNIAVVRPVNAYGPRQSVAAPYGPSKVRKIMPSFVCRALAGDPIEIYGDGTSVSDCVYVADVANVFVSALNSIYASPLGLDEITDYEVGPVESKTVNDIAQMVADEVQKQNPQSGIPLITHLPMRPGEVPNSVTRANTDTLVDLDISAHEFVPLEEGIAKTVKYFRASWLPSYQR